MVNNILNTYYRKSSFALAIALPLFFGTSCVKKQIVYSSGNQSLIFYEVQKGETLSSISDKFKGISWKVIYEENKEIIGNNPNNVKRGLKLFIPNSFTYETKTVNKRSLEEELGFTLGNIEKNREYIKTLNGNDLDLITLKLGGGKNRIKGTRKLADLIGVSPGECFASGDRALLNLENDLGYILSSAKKYHLNLEEAKIIAGINLVESGGEDFCVSSSNAVGEMGLTHWVYTSKKHSKGKILNEIKPFNSKENISRGTQIYAHLLQRYDSKRTALLAYNQSESIVDDARNILWANGFKATYENIKNLRTLKLKRNFTQLEEELNKAIQTGNKYRIRLAKNNFLKLKKAQKGGKESILIDYLNEDFGNYFISNQGRDYAQNVLNKKFQIEKIGII